MIVNVLRGDSVDSANRELSTVVDTHVVAPISVLTSILRST